MAYEIKIGNALDKLKEIDDETVDSVITSPPYFGLRDYNIDTQIGLEQTPEEYIQNLVNVFREVKRVLKPMGTVWLNIGDTYWGGKGHTNTINPNHDVFKTKDLMMIPHRIAIALQEDGWYVRQDIIWHKNNPMPEAVKDRCTKSHEYIFLLTKRRKYYYDHDAILEEALTKKKSKNAKKKKSSKYKDSVEESFNRQGLSDKRGSNLVKVRPNLPNQNLFIQFIRQTPKKILYEKTDLKQTTIDHYYRNDEWFNYPSIDDWNKIYPHLQGNKIEHMNELLTYFEWKFDEVKNTRKGKRNKRSVWTVNTKAYKKSHFAVYPPELIEPCVLTTPVKVCSSCGKGYKRIIITESLLTEEEVEELKKREVKDKNENPYSVKGSDYRKHYIEFRNLPHHELMRNYIQDARRLKGITIKQIEDEFGNQSPHHWFEKNGNYPSKDDWIILKSILDFDDTFDKQMTEIFYKSGLKGDNDYVNYGFEKDCICDTDETKPAVILDMFAGSGTTGGVAEKHGRNSILIELNPEYAKLIPERIKSIKDEV